jgi:drug/metabolite transporter (DMT)-like permease
VHFVCGRYCNYRSSQLMGVNLSAPVVQLQVPFAMMLAVVALHEKFTVLQAIGSVLMLGGSFVTQANAGKVNTNTRRKRASAPLSAATASAPVREASGGSRTVHRLAFEPRVISGYLFGVAAAMCYGSSPLMAREAFLHAPGVSTLAGGCLAYTSATLVFCLALLKPGAWRHIKGVKRENLPWFLVAALMVAVSQALVYASLALAPVMAVTPILQLSLVFRLFLSQMINRDHEVMNKTVLVGALTAVVGSILVSLNTELLTTLLGLPPPVAAFLRYRLAGH